jgi:hypothetical protein
VELYAYSYNGIDFMGELNSREQALEIGRQSTGPGSPVWTACLAPRTAPEIIDKLNFGNIVPAYIRDESERLFGVVVDGWPLENLDGHQRAILDRCIKVALRHFFATAPGAADLRPEFFAITDVEYHEVEGLDSP